MISDRDTPAWICSDCASKVTKKKPCCACYHMDICEVCNEWKEVTQPRDYGYPKIKPKYDKIKILNSLENVKQLYIDKGQNYDAQQIEKRIVQWATFM